MKITPLSISSSTLVNALGLGKNETLKALKNHQTGLAKITYSHSDFAAYLGKVAGVEKVVLEPKLQQFHCRNNQLAKLGLDADDFRQQVDEAIYRYGKHRIGVFIGTSTSGMTATESAYRHYHTHNKMPDDFDILHTHNVASAQNYVQQSLGLTGAAMTISTACSSSAKVFVSAYRHIKSGVCDAAIVGGVDSLCLTTIYGFSSLQLISEQLCRPYDVNRNGINIGEAAGFVLLEKTKTAKHIKLKGYGESSDAYHMSSPQPQGQGAKIAMQNALNSAGLAAKDIDYINLHGTATRANDAAEAQAVLSVFADEVDCSSTKGITGHTLGAAGITEAIICELVLANQWLPGTVNLQDPDPDLAIQAMTNSRHKKCQNVLSNSFGFGGSNCSLVFGL